MERYVCIHGHFYQPPRENPTLEAVQLQDSAYPYHDWNERITVECYGPNGASRILDSLGHIVKIANNYAKMSFNFGPTLLTWMEQKAPDVYQSILAADRESRAHFSGHGSAIAQAYNHIIMPLANERDKRTQVLWGIRDFEHRFGRFPEGMWLPEAAVDLATLETLAELGIRFTILAPHQAGRVRRIGDSTWLDVSGGQIDPAMAYELRLPSGRKINLFFYDGPISRTVAFDEMLNKGEFLADRLISSFSSSGSSPQLVHIATDGETYGHHRRHGDMALAYALHYIESNGLARLTNYGEFLEKHPPTHEVEIIENTSWSCFHGIERWRSNCGCTSGGHATWNQFWRTPLRDALDWLRDNLITSYEKAGRQLLKDPWAARDEYISLILDRSLDSLARFIAQHAVRGLSEAEKVKVLKLLEAQRNTMLMFTSCGWFFSEISGIETVQVLQYAGRAIQLSQEVFGYSLEPDFLKHLRRANSNIPEYRDGQHIYEEWVKPSLADLHQVGAHYAMSSLFEDYGDQARIYCYSVEREDYRLLSTGKVRLALGKARITSEITRDSASVGFGILHLGDHNLSGGIREFGDEEPYEGFVEQVADEFARGDLVQLIRVMDNIFGSASYSLKRLFRDEQRRVLDTILDSTLNNTQSIYRQVYEHQAPMMQFLRELNAPVPKGWHAAAEVVLNANIRRAFESDDFDPRAIRAFLDEAQESQITLDEAGLGYVIRQSLERWAARLRTNTEDISILQKLDDAIDLVRTLPFEVDLWRLQNVFYEMMQEVLTRLNDGAKPQAINTAEWLDCFVSLGDKLGILMSEVAEMRANQMTKTSAALKLVEGIANKRRIPLATYRLQFNRGFTFQDAEALMPYLYDLGVSDCYASPILKPRADSNHGYDICDHSQLNPALGSQEDFEAFCASVRTRQMGLILDIVPNHMGIGEASNSWWMDVLENGPSSICASYFDIDWHPVKIELQNKVLLPILEDQYGKVLESGKFRLAYEDGAFYVYYYDMRLPVAPRTYSSVLSHQLTTLAQALGKANEHIRELESILTALSYLPERTEMAPEKIAERNREKEIIKSRLATLYQSSRYVRAAIDTAVQVFNGTPGDPRSFDLLDQLLDAQAYRPAYWRVAAEEINYRRFFDINDLAAIRTELPDVFQSTHELILRLLAEEKATGLRIDHPDGLWNPREYFRLLQESYVADKVRTLLGEDLNADSPVTQWLSNQFDPRGASPSSWPLYVVAEKILSERETLPDDWMVDGTTGYDFLNCVNGLFVDSSARKAFDKIYHRFTGGEIDYRNLTNSTKKMVMLVSQVSEINALARRLERIAERNRLYRDFTLNSLTFAIREVIAALPIYRTYITGPTSVRQEDENCIEAAVEEAKKRNPRTAASVFDFIQDTLLLRNILDFAEQDRQTVVDLVMKFQQVTGPVMAKGVEDAAFYIYNRLVSLNEVGSHPEEFGISVGTFHQRNSERLERWPHSMLATSTHDTKRSEDVRARLNVLSEIPEEWQAALARWNALNASKKTQMNGQLVPDPNDEYLLYQTLLGTWPDQPMQTEEFANYRDRIAAYMHKATKEAKVHTSWVNPNEPYDAAVQDFVRGILTDETSDPFMDDLLALQQRVARYGRYNALSQVLLKLTSPGVPDIYQGTELWDYSLVDPDNRRPVDYRKRQTMLAQLKDREGDGDRQLAELARELLNTTCDGRIKLYLIHRTLNFRRAHHELFSEGGYVPLAAHGEQREHVCAFVRAFKEEAALVVVPRLTVHLTDRIEQSPIGPDVWKDTRLVLPREQTERKYRNVFTGEVLSVTAYKGFRCLKLADVLGVFPVALFERLPD